MVMLSWIGRVRDGLILATGIEGNEEQDYTHQMVKYNTQAKMLLRKLNQPNTPTMHSVESGPYAFHYIMKESVCALALCDQNFPRKVAFAFLDDIATEFLNQNRNRIDSITRPFHFLEFGESYIQQAKKKYTDKNRQAMAAVNAELQDVTRIMVSNIEDVLHRGESLNILDARADDLRGLSAKYREDARKLNNRGAIAKVLGAVGISLVLFLFFRFFYF